MMANVRMCTQCGAVYRDAVAVCTYCGNTNISMLPYSPTYWEKQSPERRAELQKQYMNNLNADSYGNSDAGEVFGSAATVDRSGRGSWIGILRAWAVIMIILGIISAVAILIVVSRFNVVIGIVSALLEVGLSVLFPAALMVIANMAADLGDMRDKQMGMKTDS